MNSLTLHCDMAYLEHVLEKHIYLHARSIVESLTNQWLHLQSMKVECRFINNSKGNYDLFIYSRLYIPLDIDLFFKEQLGLDKKGKVCYSNTEPISIGDIPVMGKYSNIYHEHICYENFTKEDIQNLAIYFKISNIVGYTFDEISEYLCKYVSSYDLGKVLREDVLFELTDIDSVHSFVNNKEVIFIMSKNLKHLKTIYDFLIKKDSNLKTLMSDITNPEGAWAFTYNWIFKLNLNKLQYLGLCHLLRKETSLDKLIKERIGNNEYKLG